MINRKIVASAFALLVSIGIFAQNSTNSPYTRFGYGKLIDGGFARTNSMGGIGLGFRSKNTINIINPAAYSEIDSTSFLFEFGLSGMMSRFASKTASSTKITGNIDYVALQFPITKWIGVSTGLVPYSFVGYAFKTKDSLRIPSNNDTVYCRNIQSFGGVGGISQVYLGMAFRFFDRLSLGVNGYYMFGEVSHARYSEQEFSDKRPTHSTTSTSTLKVRSFNTRLGLQYSQKLRENKDLLTVGAIYEFQHKLGSEYTVSTYGVDTVLDTLNNVFELPNVYGLGFTYTLDNRLMFGADAVYQQFAKAYFQNQPNVLNNRLKLSAGIEFVNKPNGNRYIDRMVWRLGANYATSYAKVNDSNLSDYAVTLGFGFPFRANRSMLNLHLEYGGMGAMHSSNLLKENYLKVGISFSLNEMWFYRLLLR